jgi:Ser/Thr protein kinase RdoA (MazF antagonist)
MNLKYTPSVETLKIILAEYNITNFTYKQSSDGIENTTIFVFANNINYVLRVYRLGSRTDAEIKTEIEFIDFLSENVFPVPEIYPNINGDLLTKVSIVDQEWQVILMEKIHGVEIPKNEWVKNSDLLENMAHTQATLHMLGAEFAQIKMKNDYELQVSDSGVGKTLIDRLNEIKKVDDLGQDLVEIISSIKSQDYQYDPFLPLGFIHDDIDWNNLILDDQDVINVIDFGDLRVGPIVSCLASGLFTVILSAFELGESIEFYAQKYIDFYREIRVISEIEILEVLKPIELTVDLYLVSEILRVKETNVKLENFLKLKALIKTLQLN